MNSLGMGFGPDRVGVVRTVWRGRRLEGVVVRPLVKPVTTDGDGAINKRAWRRGLELEVRLRVGLRLEAGCY